MRALDRALRVILPESAADANGNTAFPPPRRLLLAKSVGMGDGVLVRSVAEHLLRLKPTLELGVLGCPPVTQVVGSNSPVRIHSYDPATSGARAILALLREVRAARYDAAIDFEAFTLLSATFIRMAGIPVRIGLKPPAENPRARLLTHAVAMDLRRSMWSHFIDLARIVEPRMDDSMGVTPLRCSEAVESWAMTWWEQHTELKGALPVAIHLGTGVRGSYRRWPIARFTEVATRLRTTHGDVVVLLTGTTHDAPLLREFQSAYNGPLIDASDAGSLERAACLLSRCSLLLSNDTGVMHLGAAMGTPTIGLFGPTSVPHWAPLGERAVALRGTSLPCSPCVDTYRARMPMRCSHVVRSQCMLDITVDMVLRTAEQFLASGRAA